MSENGNKNNSNNERVVEISQKIPQNRVNFNNGADGSKSIDTNKMTKPRQQNP